MNKEKCIGCQHCGRVQSLDQLLDNTGHGPEASGPNSGWQMSCQCGLSFIAENRNDAIDGWIQIQSQLAIAKGRDADDIFFDSGDDLDRALFTLSNI